MSLCPNSMTGLLWMTQKFIEKFPTFINNDGRWKCVRQGSWGFYGKYRRRIVSQWLRPPLDVLAVKQSVRKSSVGTIEENTEICSKLLYFHWYIIIQSSAGNFRVFRPVVPSRHNKSKRSVIKKIIRSLVATNWALCFTKKIWRQQVQDGK